MKLTPMQQQAFNLIAVRGAYPHIADWVPLDELYRFVDALMLSADFLAVTGVSVALQPVMPLKNDLGEPWPTTVLGKPFSTDLDVVMTEESEHGVTHYRKRGYDETLCRSTGDSELVLAIGSTLVNCSKCKRRREQLKVPK